MADDIPDLAALAEIAAAEGQAAYAAANSPVGIAIPDATVLPSPARFAIHSIDLNGQQGVLILLYTPTGVHGTFWGPDAARMFANAIAAHASGIQIARPGDLPNGGRP